MAASAPGRNPIDVRPDIRVFLFALAASVMAAALTSLAPIRLASDLDPNVALKTVGGISTRRRLPTRDLLVGFQVALCCVLVSSAFWDLPSCRIE
jgi:hypothetical protein